MTGWRGNCNDEGTRVSNVEGVGSARPGSNGAWSERRITILFLLFLAILGSMVAFALFQDGKEWVLLLALVAGVLFWFWERLEPRYLPMGLRMCRAAEGYFLPIGVVSAATFAACFPTLRTYFIADDFAYIHYFHTISLTQVLRLFHTDMAQVLWADPRQELRPFYALYYMLSYQCWGIHPLGYHFVNLLLHIINCSLILLIVKELAPQKSWRGGFAALLFAVLPLHADVFFWATGAPAELIPVFFYLAAFLCFMRFRATGSARYFVITVLAFAACLSSKETGVTLP